jgi:NitT/TauT family transport system permease protein
MRASAGRADPRPIIRWPAARTLGVLEARAPLCQACARRLKFKLVQILPLSIGCSVMPIFAPSIATRRAVKPKLWDALAAVIVLGFIVFLGETSATLVEPLAELKLAPVTLDPANLPAYAARTTLRMLVALIFSLLFTFTYATLAAKHRRAEPLLVAMLDILQSVPILGFISVTIVFFMSLAPGRVLGAELAAVFAIFTSQAWNMAFSFYQSLRTVPHDLDEAAKSMRLSAWMKFWRLEVPFAIPGLVWNMMMSMSGGWFFVVASEAISVGNTTVMLPGIGSYISVAIEQRDLTAILWAIGTMMVVILIYDLFLFRPLVAWADRFRPEQQSGVEPAASWVLTVFQRSQLVHAAGRPLAALWRLSFRIAGLWSNRVPQRKRPLLPAPVLDGLWLASIAAIVLYSVWAVTAFLTPSLVRLELPHVVGLALLTLLRVVVLIVLASAFWVPIGILIGLNPKLSRIVQPIAQFLAAFPANLLFPLAVVSIVALRLDPDIWLSLLMILGTQWYILFNVIAGAAVIPREFLDVGASFRVGGWHWWRHIALPAVFPYYMTGAITASGGSLNASIVAEVVSWGDTKLVAHGIGAYIAEATAKGDFQRIVLGIAVMSACVVVVNRAFWRPLYLKVQRRYRLD